MGTPEQNRIARENIAKYQKTKEAEKLGSAARRGAVAGAADINAGAGDMGAGAQDMAIPGGQKKGGKVKKMQTGGTCS